MSTVWCGVWFTGVLALLVSCSSSPQPALAPLSANPQVLEQAYQAGRVAFKERRYDDAAARFASVVAANPEHLKARLNWAAALSYSNKGAEAIVQCQNVLARDPTNAAAYYQWGAVLARLQRHQEALEKFDQALALQPMAELLQEDAALQRSLQGYLKRHRRQAPEDASIKIRPQPATGR